MQYVVIAHDGKDENALERRMKARDAHLAMGDKLKAEGNLLYGAALLDKTEKMIGSIYICEFSSRDELNLWLENEPYVKGNVWKEVEIQPCRVGPSFQK